MTDPETIDGSTGPYKGPVGIGFNEGYDRGRKHERKRIVAIIDDMRIPADQVLVSRWHKAFDRALAVTRTAITKDGPT